MADRRFGIEASSNHIYRLLKTCITERAQLNYYWQSNYKQTTAQVLLCQPQIPRFQRQFCDLAEPRHSPIAVQEIQIKR
jgi:hypothetical protein